LSARKKSEIAIDLFQPDAIVSRLFPLKKHRKLQNSEGCFMRRATIWWSLVILLAVSRPALCQFRTVPPSEIKYQPVDTTQALAAPINQPSSGSRFGNLFSMFRLPGSQKGKSRLGGPSAPITTLPTSPNNPLRPVMPITGR
jgi:hypothetical protein